MVYTNNASKTRKNYLQPPFVTTTFYKLQTHTKKISPKKNREKDRPPTHAPSSTIKGTRSCPHKQTTFRHFHEIFIRRRGDAQRRVINSQRVHAVVYPAFFRLRHGAPLPFTCHLNAPWKPPDSRINARKQETSSFARALVQHLISLTSIGSTKAHPLWQRNTWQSKVRPIISAHIWRSVTN